MKLIKIDETLVEISDMEYCQLIKLHAKTLDHYNSLTELSKARKRYLDYIDSLLRTCRYPSIQTFKSTL